MKPRKTLNYIIIFFSIWATALLFINIRPIISFINFKINENKYNATPKDNMPHNSKYESLNELVSLSEDTTHLLTNPKNLININGLPKEAKVNYRRMRFIMKYLKDNNIGFYTARVNEIPAEQLPTSNIFIKLGKSDNFTLLTAHYDILPRPGLQGALDNSASISILLNLLAKYQKQFRDRNIAVLFTTLEEKGMLGAKHFVSNQNYKIQKVICLDGVGRGRLASMNISDKNFGIKFKNLLFKDRLYTGNKIIDCPDFAGINDSVIDFDKYKIEKLHSFISATDASVFLKAGIPTVHLTSNDIVHFSKVLHNKNDVVEGISFQALSQCEFILADYIKSHLSN